MNLIMLLSLGTQEVKLLGLFRQGHHCRPLLWALSWSVSHSAHKKDAEKTRNDTTGICPVTADAQGMTQA